MKKHLPLSILVILAALSASAEVVHYKIDPVHSGIEFKVRHFLNKIPGTFASFEGDILFDKDDPAKSSVTATIEVKSIDTRNEKRDAHLQSDDYFKAGAFPNITFASTEWIAASDNTYTVKGILSMLGVDKAVELQVTFLGEMEARGSIRSGWEGTTKIDRNEWGLSAGKPAVGDEVEIELNIQARRE
ncbi:MAG TPA: YceI family protein [Oceanipulchritudo sp.]|nr:YceI family protein [Oceanipulchritudo sp.]